MQVFLLGGLQLNDFIDWLAQQWQAFIDWCYEIIIFILNAFMWLALQTFERLLEGFRFVFAMIDPPQFIQSGISALTSGIPSDIGYLLGATGFSDALALIGLGYTFRLTRKVLTLFQW